MASPLDIATLPTGHLPPVECVQELTEETYEKFRGENSGKNAAYIPALAEVSPHLFGLCVAEISGALHEAGDTAVEFSIQSVSKPFVFGLICQSIGEEAA